MVPERECGSRTAVPAGLLLSEILHRHGIASVVLEKHSGAHVLSRIRAGVLEQTTVEDNGNLSRKSAILVHWYLRC
jgi:FAD binding domain